MREKIGRYAVLNVVLQPHPDGAYERLFRAAGADKTTISYFGDRDARISPISPVTDGIFNGRLATWLEIDSDGNVINKDTLDEYLFSESNINLPSTIGFNSRIFNFSFRVSDHRLFVELLNDEGEVISIGSVQRIIWRILDSVRSDGEELDVHIVSRSSAVDYVLETPGLKKLEIVVNLPNPDIVSSDTSDEIFAAIDAMHAKQVRLEVTKRADAPALALTPGVKKLAEMTAENGFTKAVGRSEDGTVLERSTKDVPDEIQTVLGIDESRAAATRRVARSQIETI